MNRIAVATILGVLAGLVCMLGVMSMGVKMTAVLAIWILLNRAVMGFVIGISGVRLHWALHGPLMGLIVGSLFSYGLYLLNQPVLAVGVTVAGNLVLGFLIELVTTVVCKRPQQQTAPVSKPPAMAA